MPQSRPSLFLVCPRLVLLMFLTLLAGLTGCGSGSSDNSPTLGQRGSMGEVAPSQKNPSPRTDSFTTSAARSAAGSPVPLASENGMGSVPEKGKATVGDSTKAEPGTSGGPLFPVDALDVPVWIAKDLNSPDVDTRLRALETWALIAPVGSIDPLILAYGNNDNELVRTRAMELIQQDWARAADRGL